MYKPWALREERRGTEGRGRRSEEVADGYIEGKHLNTDKEGKAGNRGEGREGREWEGKR